MTTPEYFSIRMRASREGRHVSGAERLVRAPEVTEAAVTLLQRAAGRAERVHLTVERIPPAAVTDVPCLPVTTVAAAGPEEARAVAAALLERAGVAPGVVEAAFAGLCRGLGERGAGLRGAALVDAAAGARLDPDRARGVRASHLDYSPEGREALQAALAGADLTHFRVGEALAVASKVLWAGVLAELCWSDEPEYRAGYVSTREAGYVRFPFFKPAGAVGGRVFFLAPGTDAETCRERLERRSALIVPPVRISGPVSPIQFLTLLNDEPGRTPSEGKALPVAPVHPDAGVGSG